MAKKGPALPRAIIDLDDFTESINFLCFGDSGVGKTVLMGTLEECLILAVEPGTIAAKRQGSKAKVWPIKHWNDFVEAYEWVRDNPGVFKWVGIDTATAAQTRALRAILENAVKNNPERDPDIPAIQDHQKWQNMLKRYVLDFNELPINVMWNAQAMRKEDEEGDDLVLPLILGKDYEISAWLCAQMHVVGYLGLKKITRKGPDGRKVTREVRRLLVQPSPPYFAKDRYDALGRWIDDPTMPQIIGLIEDSGDENIRRANKKREEDAQGARSFKGSIEEDDGDKDEGEENPDQSQEPSEPDDDEAEEVEETKPVKEKVATKKATAGRKFRATKE